MRIWCLRRSGALAFLVVVAATGCGEGDSGPAAPTAVAVPTTFTLSGIVTESAPTTETPIPGATVAIVDGPGQGRTATADASGAFRFTGLTSAGFNIRSSASGYEESVAGINLAGDTVAQVHLRPVRREIYSVFGGPIRLDDETRCPYNNGSAACRTYTIDVHHDGRIFTGVRRLRKLGVMHVEIWQAKSRLDTTDRNISGSGALEQAVTGGLRYEVRALYVAGPNVDNEFEIFLLVRPR